MTIELRDRLIDAHVHVWTSDLKEYPLAPGFDRADLWTPTCTPEQIADESSMFGEVRLNLVQMTWYGLDHSYILALIADAPNRYVGTGIVPAVTDVTLPSPDKTMVELARQGVYAFRMRGGNAGMRKVLGERWLDHPSYEKMFAAGAEHNLALSFLMTPADMPEIDRICTRYPDTPVILDHLGGVRIRDGVFPKDELDELCKLSKHPRVMVKIGPVNYLGDGNPPYLDTLALLQPVIEAFGPGRCMWESDNGGPASLSYSPNNYPAETGLIVDHADFLSDSDKEWLMFRTADSFFFSR